MTFKFLSVPCVYVGIINYFRWPLSQRGLRKKQLWGHLKSKFGGD